MNTLTYVPIPRSRILAIDPITKGFGFAVLEEDPLQLVDWGTAIGPRTSAGVGARLGALLSRYHPTQLVIENPRTARLAARQVALATFIHYATLATRSTCSIRLVSVDEVHHAFAPLEATTKEAIASVLAAMFSELRPHLPPHRHISMSEDSRWAIFDAVALALTASNAGSGSPAIDTH